MALFHAFTVFMHASWILVGDATLLPSFDAAAPGADVRVAALQQTGRWRVQVDDTVYHAPEEQSELSTNVNDYYYALGSHSGISDELKPHRVGGQGRVHIFHIPKEHTSSLLEKTQHGKVGDRRSAFSALTQLKAEVKLSTQFDPYIPHAKDYVNPLSEAGKAVEKAAVGEITSATFSGFLKELSDLGTRSYSSSSGTEKAVQLLQRKFESMGFATCLHHFQPSYFSGSKLVNVVAYAPGKSAESIIVGAHYDSRPFSGPAPGAEDNGSGVSGLLAMAQAFKKTKVANDKSVYFVGFAGEEPGCLGSAAFAKEINSGGGNLPQQCKPPGGSFLEVGKDGKAANSALIMDEIGWVSPSLPKQTINLESYDSSAEMMDHMYHSCIDHNSDALAIVHNGAPFGSDHMSFLSLKMQSVLAINGDDEAYPNYHQSTDTIDKVTPDYATRIVKMNMGALIRMAGVVDGGHATLMARSMRRKQIARHS